MLIQVNFVRLLYQIFIIFIFFYQEHYFEKYNNWNFIYLKLRHSNYTITLLYLDHVLSKTLILLRAFFHDCFILE